MKAKPDGYTSIDHYHRTGPICQTRFLAGRGYFWNYMNDWANTHGPFITRQAACKNEEKVSSSRTRKKRR